MKQSKEFIAKLSLLADKKYLGPGLDFIEETLKSTGLDDTDVMKMRLAAEEASINVIEHAFDPEEFGTFDLIVSKKSTKVTLAVADKGLPIDYKKIEEDDDLGFKLMKGVTDEVRFLSLGRDGKRIELIKEFDYKDFTEALSESEIKELEETGKERIEKANLELRLMRPDEALMMTRCVYRSYGYSYMFDYLYYPDKIREKLEGDYVKAAIAIDKNTDEIVGHLALIFNKPGDNVGETGQAVVDPRYRGHSLFKKMKLFLVDYARKSGMYGVYSEAVTVHPFTQKGNLSIGATETGFLLCYLPDTIKFKKIQDDKTPKLRQSAVLFYLKTGEEPSRKLYPPKAHFEIIKKIYDRSELNRTLEVTGNPDRTSSEVETTRAEMKLVEEAKLAFIIISGYGSDFEHMLRYRLKDLRERKIELIFVDLPLSDPATSDLYEEVEKLGFFFVGVIPELYEDDVVRFAYLNDVPIDPDIIARESDFAHELFDYVYAEKQAKDLLK